MNDSIQRGEQKSAKAISRFVLAIITLISTAACDAESIEAVFLVPTATYTTTPAGVLTPTDRPTYTATATATLVKTHTPTNTKTASPTPTEPPTNTLTYPLTPTGAPSATPTPTETPTGTPRPTKTPTNTPLPTPAPTSTFTPRPTFTPTPLARAPKPISPLTEENPAVDQGAVRRFEWVWEGNALTQGALFSFKIVRIKDNAECLHIQIPETFFEGRVNCDASERYFWQVTVARPIFADGSQVGWVEVSEPSSPQYFDYRLSSGGNGKGCEPFCD